MIQQIETFRLLGHPKNPRLSHGDLTELKDSIAANGIFQNLTVVETDTVGLYTIIIGHRRHAAAILAGLDTVPCVVVEMDEKKQQATMLLENMQRSDLTPFEEAQGIQMCMDLGMTESDITSKTGFSKSTVRRRLKILELDKDKVKTAQGSLEDYIALEEIEDVEVRNNLLKHMGTNNFNLEIEKAKIKQEEIVDVEDEVLDNEDDQVLDDTPKQHHDIYKKLRESFMTDVFKRKIAKEETAQSVMIPPILAIENEFKMIADVEMFHRITNPNGLPDGDLIVRVVSHRINFFVVYVYCLLEKHGDLLNLYDHLKIFGYKLSDEEQELLENVED